MLFIKSHVLVAAALFVCSRAIDTDEIFNHDPQPLTHNTTQAVDPGYVSSCPHTMQKQMPIELYDSYHNWVKIDQRGRGQFFYFAICNTQTGPPACRTCCAGTDTRQYASQCKPVKALQAATVCLTKWCSRLSRRWVYIDTGCACYYERRLPQPGK